MADDLAARVQRTGVLGRLSPRRVLSLPIEQIRPVIRIAHRRAGPLNIPRRIVLDHELVLIVAGRGQLVLDDGPVAFGPHDLLFIPPFVPHAFATTDPRDTEHVAVHFDWAPDFPASSDDPRGRRPYEVRLAPGEPIPMKLSLAAGHLVEQRLTDLLKAWDAGDAVGQLEAAGHLTAVIAWVLRQAGRADDATSADAQQPAGRNRWRVQRAIDHARAHLREKLTAADLARAAGVSRGRLAALFRDVTGYPPLEYLRRMRVDEARRLLGDVDLSVKEVAARCGFDDVFHFSRVFRKVDGLSPSHFRQALLAGRSPGEPAT
jgi:AraC-like DNA-binding protein